MDDRMPLSDADRAAAVREVAGLLWDWEGSGELYDDFAERIVRVVEDRFANRAPGGSAETQSGKDDDCYVVLNQTAYLAIEKAATPSLHVLRQAIRNTGYSLSGNLPIGRGDEIA